MAEQVFPCIHPAVMLHPKAVPVSDEPVITQQIFSTQTPSISKKMSPSLFDAWEGGALRMTKAVLLSTLLFQHLEQLHVTSHYPADLHTSPPHHAPNLWNDF